MVPESTQAGEENCTVNIVKVPGALNTESAMGMCKIVVSQNTVIGSAGQVNFPFL